MNLKDLLAKRDSINEELAAINQQAAAVRECLADVDAEIEIAISDPVVQARRLAGKDTGTVDVLVQGVMVKHCLSKRVVWDQKKLAALRDKTTAANDDPDTYMKSKTSYSVSEKDYKSFPEPVQAIFAEAREVKTGAPKITFDLDWRS